MSTKTTLHNASSRAFAATSSEVNRLEAGFNIDLKLFVIVMDNKGGVGKSKMAEICYYALANPAGGTRKVYVGETDNANKTMNMTVGAEFIDLDAVEWQGHLEDIGHRMAEGEFDHAVLDLGARSEGVVKKFLPEFADLLKPLGVRLVIVRPITLSTFVQNNASRFCSKTKTDEMGVVMVRNLSQGREEKYFADWMKSDTRTAMIARGAIEIDMEDAGPRWSDEAIGFRLSFSDIAFSRFDKIKDDELRGLAIQIFTGPVQRFLTRWLKRQAEVFATALFKAAERP
ncbi:hypothetical protein SAMN05428997_12444 [Bosea sp. CRIB-10]|jgi:hypothetical protein|uniref:hypothetical protein n=1 Tax=Bosea sp. CRIB-10 TaxID=378404 RepID=UPI0008F40693|nr:hypothetical protein [Bosea sp. CRIB-10]SFD31430.1 hypothetical protein SAMN05428997_12444 [Bosea sp. CRIB-10]